MGKHDLLASEMSAGPRGGLLGVLDGIAVIQSRGECAVLGVVVATAGSTYQKPGALVLLDRSGLRSGVISGGCLEPELEARAREVLGAGAAQLSEFDTRNDADRIFGSGTGCRGHLSLLLLPLPPTSPLAQALRALANSSTSLELLLDTCGDQIGRGVAHLKNESWRWNRNGEPLAQESTRIEPPVEAERVNVRIAAPPRLLLLGAGPETPTLVALARRLGWHLTVVEHRGRWRAFAAGADRCVALAPAAAASALATECPDAVVAMSHNYALDMQHLEFCAQRHVAYIGLLGPPARRDALLAELGESLAAQLRARLHAPVGLDLGGSGPEAIALAIAAELQGHFARRAAVPPAAIGDADGR